MISFWQFDKKIGTFKCIHSYATPEIVPFAGESKQERSNQTYLMQSKDGEIFYFQKRDKIGENAEIQLCIITLNKSESPSIRDIKVQEFNVGQGSKLYKYMLMNHEKTSSARDYSDVDQLLHMTPPGLFRYEKDYFCAFTMSPN